MIQSFYTGNAGLNANKNWLSVISDNIANVNTIGFKAERVNFEDLISSSLTTFANNSPKNMEIGGGSFVGSTTKDFSQGALMNTNTPTDLALDGEGFFMVRDAQDVTYYTRAGQFRTDANGDLINLNGMKLLGWQLDDAGNIAGAIGAINIPNDMPPHVTTKLALKEPTNLDAGSELVTGVFDTSDARTYSYVNAITVYDSLGVPHEAQLYFVHTGPNQWRVFGLMDDEPIQFNVPGDANTYDALVVEFNGVGQINRVFGYGINTDQTITGAGTETESGDLGQFTLNNTPVLPGSVVITQYTDGATTYNVNWIDDGHGNIIDLNNDNRVVGSISYDDGTVFINQFAGNGATETLTAGSYKTYDTTVSTNTIPPDSISIVPIPVNNPNSATLNTGGNPIQFTLDIQNMKQVESEFIFYAEQDGYAKGDLLSVSVSEDGLVRGVYSNGQVKDWARIAIATFNDKEILIRKGNNLFLPNSQTYTPIIVPGGVISKIRGGFLELSNVDISREFINLITAQRAYQANARTITTSDQVLQETMNIKR
ncbi:MAG TPA: flagellar hook protein FlgE [Persephonella sp.]|uniref:Flagellar hook protein FlgE n=1 Tax=Persephonella marina (strain DSM 14350 / EX-H1) TaxID=123214 RepID=C0QPA5_PERMH|nr:MULTISPECIES: flagellar hook protein FlgE [Persephonella]ACO03105.1 flagellar basal body and hook protein FlgE [Persephonella marina EX-H1]HCB69884.1 flagellar hook protein FlgE [Persephonella sp.]